MARLEWIDVMVCLATVMPPKLIRVRVPAPATVADAVRASGALGGGDVPIEACRLSVYGKRSAPDAPLHARDRVEINGPLIADPKTARWRRVRRARAMGAREGQKWLRRETVSEERGG